MALTVETGAGLADANSYLSLADANAYHADHSGSSTWAEAADTDKERALRLATQYLDIQYGPRWRGTRANEDQALAWPREGVVQWGRFSVGSTVVPQLLRNATAEAALRVLAGDDLLADQTDPAPVKSQTVKVGPISETTEYATGNGPAKRYPLIDGMIRPLLRAAGEIRRA